MYETVYQYWELGGIDMESILNSIKKLLGIAEDYDHFDSDIIMHINSVFTTLTQLGVGPEDGFSINDEAEKWEDFLPEERMIHSVKSYMFMKVKLMFDPPLSSAVIECTKEQIREMEWRLQIAAETTEDSTQ